jgi:hypothetical protein
MGSAACEKRPCGRRVIGGSAGGFTEALIGEFRRSDRGFRGAFAIEQGFLFTAMLLSAAVVGVIERRGPQRRRGASARPRSQLPG